MNAYIYRHLLNARLKICEKNIGHHYLTHKEKIVSFVVDIARNYKGL